MSLNPLDRIQSYYDELTKTDREIAVYIINNPQIAAVRNIDIVSKNVNVSKSAVSRFVKRIGYSTYSEFRIELSRFLVSQNAEVGSDYKSDSPILGVTQIYCDYILELRNRCSIEQLKKIAKLFLKSKDKYIFGINRTYNSARQLQFRLARLGFNVFAVGDTGLIQDYADNAAKNDLIFIFSITDNTHIYDSLIQQLHKKGVNIIIITMSQTFPSLRVSNEYIVLPRISKDKSLSFLDDQPIFMIFIEILLNVIASNGDK